MQFESVYITGEERQLGQHRTTSFRIPTTPNIPSLLSENKTDGECLPKQANQQLNFQQTNKVLAADCDAVPHPIYTP